VRRLLADGFVHFWVTRWSTFDALVNFWQFERERFVIAQIMRKINGYCIGEVLPFLERVRE